MQSCQEMRLHALQHLPLQRNSGRPEGNLTLIQAPGLNAHDVDGKQDVQQQNHQAHK